jgi:hypothetical protein
MRQLISITRNVVPAVHVEDDVRPAFIGQDFQQIAEPDVAGSQCVVSAPEIFYDIGYDGESIHFVSLMPSSNRTCRVWMRPVDRDKVEARWTFTERELWVRKSPTVRVLPPNEG